MTLRQFLKHTAIGRLLVIPYRFVFIALPHAARQFGEMVRWTFASKEHYNHTYQLTPLNLRYLASYVAVVTGRSQPEIETYIGELEADDKLRRLLVERALASPERHNSDIEPRYGRRLGWYALIRAVKPRIVLETGVDRGLGTAVIAAALLRNSAEGSPGIVLATDIVPACGHLLAEPYSSVCRLLIGDSVQQLRLVTEPVDVFLHDSDHHPEYEWAEYLAIEPRLHAGSVIMSDNSQQTTKLLEFAERTKRSFLFFQDQPQKHWWPGDGIGVAFVLGTRPLFQQARGGANATQS